jgi:hypothetical protein
MDDNDGPPFEGSGPDLHAALTQAWHKAKDKTEARTFTVDSVKIVCENPITTYIVIINPSG